MASIKQARFCEIMKMEGLSKSTARKAINKFSSSSSSSTTELIRPLFGIILYLVFLSLVIILKDFCSSFSCMVSIFKSMFSGVWNAWGATATASNTAVNEDVNPSLEIRVPCRKENLGLLQVKKAILQEEEMEKIAGLFEEEEPSLEEVKEAFDVFDENKDGFIDGKELANVLSCLCLVEASEDDCRRIIKSFDHNLDGLIDLSEFVKVIETSLC